MVKEKEVSKNNSLGGVNCVRIYADTAAEWNCS